jgi:hypothetical protein
MKGSPMRIPMKAAKSKVNPTSPVALVRGAVASILESGEWTNKQKITRRKGREIP